MNRIWMLTTLYLSTVIKLFFVGKTLIIEMTRLIYYNVTAIKVILSILVVLICTYFFLFGGRGQNEKFFMVRLSF